MPIPRAPFPFAVFFSPALLDGIPGKAASLFSKEYLFHPPPAVRLWRPFLPFFDQRTWSSILLCYRQLDDTKTLVPVVLSSDLIPVPFPTPPKILSQTPGTSQGRQPYESLRPLDKSHPPCFRKIFRDPLSPTFLI